MRVLYLSPRECWPPNSGAKLRDYHLARALGQDGDLTYVYFGREQTVAEAARNMPFATTAIAVPPPNTYTPGKILRGLFGRNPLPVENYTSNEMTARLGGLLQTRQFDVVHIDIIHLHAYISVIRKRTPNVPIMLNWHNIESEAMFRYAVTGTGRLRRLYARLTARRLQRLERRALKTYFGHVVCSRREERELRRTNGSARIATIENGVDTRYFAAQTGSRSRKRLLFVGLMSYYANVDGIRWFVREIWPGLRARFPELLLTVVGANPNAAVLALRSEPGVEVTGTVADVRPFYAEAFAAIVPLRTGGGTRLKILEAMAAGVPVVSTRLGAEGLAVADKVNILFAEDNASWAGGIQKLRDSPYRDELTRNARELVRSQYDWDIIGRKLLATYREWLAQKCPDESVCHDK